MDDATDRDSEVTREAGRRTPAVSPVEPRGAVAPASATRYGEGRLLARGGMGDVHELSDHLLGRVVAHKQMNEGADDAHDRFFREARVQAQLEHPAIVPVYDLEPGDAPSFTMKRVQGVTLLDAVRRGSDEVSDARFAPRRLLDALATICMALDYAHRRGVVHRDVKPANVMLGQWGEVYLLDWGVARVQHDDSEDTLPVDAAAGRGDHTTVVGTPGYMAPELLQGADLGSARTDVYALGATLFFALTGELLHPGRAEQRYASTLAGFPVDARLADLGIELPLELVGVLRRATAPAEERFASARELHDAIKRYLDGDRDLELRRDVADRLVARAEVSLRRLAEREERRDRRSALRDLVSALALRPDDERATRRLMELMTEPPRGLPSVVQHRLERAGAARIAQLGGPTATATVVLMLLLFGLASWLGVRSWLPIALTLAAGSCTALAMLAESRAARRRAAAPAPEPSGRRSDVLALLCLTMTVALLTTVFSPWLVCPSIVVGVTVMRTLRDPRQPWLVATLMGGALLVPWALEMSGALPSTVIFERGDMIVRSFVVDYPAEAMRAGLVTTVIMSLAVAAAVPSRLRRAFAEAELRDQLRAWQLDQLLPQPQE